MATYPCDSSGCKSRVTEYEISHLSFILCPGPRATYRITVIACEYGKKGASAVNLEILHDLIMTRSNNQRTTQFFLFFSLFLSHSSLFFFTFNFSLYFLLFSFLFLLIKRHFYHRFSRIDTADRNGVSLLDHTHTH